MQELLVQIRSYVAHTSHLRELQSHRFSLILNFILGRQCVGVPCSTIVGPWSFSNDEQVCIGSAP